jgi:hypothetical protein
LPVRDKAAGKFRGEIGTIRRASSIAAYQQLSALGKGAAHDFRGALKRGLEGMQGLKRVERLAGGFFKNTHGGGTAEARWSGRRCQPRSAQMQSAFNPLLKSVIDRRSKSAHDSKILAA